MHHFCTVTFAYIGDWDFHYQLFTASDGFFGQVDITIIKGGITQAVSEFIQWGRGDVLIFATLWTGCFALIVIDWNLSGGTWKSNGKLARRIYPAGQDTCQWFTTRYSRLPHFNDGVTERFHFRESQRTSVSQCQNNRFACFLHFSNEFLLNGRQFYDGTRCVFATPLFLFTHTE